MPEDALEQARQMQFSETVPSNYKRYVENATSLKFATEPRSADNKSLRQDFLNTSLGPSCQVQAHPHGAIGSNAGTRAMHIMPVLRSIRSKLPPEPT